MHWSHELSLRRNTFNNKNTSGCRKGSEYLQLLIQGASLTYIEEKNICSGVCCLIKEGDCLAQVTVTGLTTILIINNHNHNSKHILTILIETGDIIK